MQSIFKIQTTSSLTHEVEFAFVYAFDILFTFAFILTCVIRDSAAAKARAHARMSPFILYFIVLDNWFCGGADFYLAPSINKTMLILEQETWELQ